MELIERNENNSLNLLDFKEKFLEYIDVSDKTIETYNIAINQFGEYLRFNSILRPTREDIINYRESLKKGHKPNTVNGYMIAIRNFFKYLEYEGIYKNITENVKNIKIENKHIKRGLSAEEVQKVLGTCKNDREVLMIKMMISCGLRSNELVNIRLEDFKRAGNAIMLNILGKGREGYKQDEVKIDPRLFEEVLNYVKDNNVKDYLFTSTSHNSYGNKLTTRTIRKDVKRIFVDAGLDNIELLSAHSLRHTACDLSLESGMSIQEVSENMRHKSIATTMIYKNELDKKTSFFADKLCDILYEKEEKKPKKFLARIFEKVLGEKQNGRFY